MRIGIFAKTFPGTDPATTITAARTAGYDTVQYNMACSGLPPMPDAIPDGTLQAIANAASQTPITALSATYNMIHPDPAVRTTGLNRLKLLIKSAATLHIPMVTLCTGTRDATDQWRAHPDNETPAAWADLLTELAKAAELAEAQGILLGIEPELANVVSSAAKARKLLDTLQSPSLAIILDPANLFETSPAPGKIINHAIDLLAGRIHMAHAKDRAPDGSFATAGKGVINFPSFLATLKASGFTGDLITHGLTPDEAPGVARYLRSLT